MRHNYVITNMHTNNSSQLTLRQRHVVIRRLELQIVYEVVDHME